MPCAHRRTDTGQNPWSFWTSPVASDPGSHLGKWPAERAHSPRMSKRAPDQPCGTSEGPSVDFMQWIHQLRAGISSLYQTRLSPKLKRHPHKSFPLPHDHRIDPRWRGKRLRSAPYHNNHCIALTTFGEEVHKTGFTDRAETCSDEEDIRLDAFLKSKVFFGVNFNWIQSAETDVPPLMMYSLKIGIMKSPASTAKVGLTPGNTSMNPQLSVPKVAKAPALMMPCGW